MIYLVALGLQWWIQVAVIIFMMQKVLFSLLHLFTSKDTEDRSIKLTTWITTFFVTLVVSFGIFGKTNKNNNNKNKGIIINSKTYNQFSSFDIGELGKCSVFLFPINSYERFVFICHYYFNS